MANSVSSSDRGEDVNEADHLAFDPVMRQVVGGRAVDAKAASASQMGRFETETLALTENRAALVDLNGQWIGRFGDPCLGAGGTRLSVRIRQHYSVDG